MKLLQTLGLIGLSTLDWLAKHKLPVCVFGALLAVILIVRASVPDPILKAHIDERQFQVHFGWGVAAYLLFLRLLLTVERVMHKRTGVVQPKQFPWWVVYFAPVAVLLCFNVTNEFVFAFTETFTRNPFGGDWARCVRDGDMAKRWKSIADLAGWLFGSLGAAWFCYYMPERLWDARRDYLRRKAA